MNDAERDELLIRVDERTAASQRWEINHDNQHEKEKAARWKLLSPLYAALIAVCAKLIFWN
jgi:cytochrome c-type biogenesis protein CcmH/NrfG